MAVLSGLYGVLCAFCAFATWRWRLPLDTVFIGSAVALLVSFVLAPWLTDFSLSWLHQFRWAQPDDLPVDLQRFIVHSCAVQGIPVPAIGLLLDGNPNAFTYGHYPGNARLVLTQGTLDILEEKELEAVVGHELGHVVHWDMAVMTLAALVPMVLYGIYQVCVRGERRDSSNEKDKGQLELIGLVAFALYYLTEYVVLFLSRVRELYADRFSGEITRDPNALSSALVKIAYGLAGRRKEKNEDDEHEHATTRALGIFDPVAAMGLVASSMTGAGKPSPESIFGAMQWDLWNPWAKYYELKSTHPLPARRLELLGRQAAAYGQTPYVNFDVRKPESYWDEFFVDLAVLWLPLIMAAAVGAGAYALGIAYWRAAGLAVGAWGAGEFVRLRFSYREDFFSPMTVSAVLKVVKVSDVRSIPVSLKGKIIGRGVPGYIISEDLVLQDETGFIFLDYRQPLAPFQWIFALTRVPGLIGREVEVKGWYRRSPTPHVELRTLSGDGPDAKGYTLEAKRIAAIVVALAGLIGALVL